MGAFILCGQFVFRHTKTVDLTEHPVSEQRTGKPLLGSPHAISPFMRPQETDGRFRRICGNLLLLV